jgi:hypothetical protein
MRSIVTLMLLAPAFMFAVSLQPVTVLPDDGTVLPSSPQTGSGPSRQARFTIGTVDTVGGTTYDWGANGPALRMLTRIPGVGVHVVFMYSAEMVNTTFPDRNIRYNFYDYSQNAWNWTDLDFMQSGVNTFAERTGYGCVDVDTNGVAVISAHHATAAGIAPIVARDAGPGVGIFDYAPGEPTIDQNAWAWIGVNNNGAYQLGMIDNVSQNNLLWSRSTAWQTWEPGVSIPSPHPEPNFPDHNLTTSKVPGSNKLCISWVGSVDAGYQQDSGFYRESPDGGDNWDPPVVLSFPPAFTPGSESVPSFHITSLFPMYDRNDNLHIVGNVGPYVRDTNWILPGQIWHWCAANPDTWSLIRVASPDSFNAAVGYNAMVCDRPSLGQDEWGNLFVAWEEFDGVNVEPGPPTRLRADIWYSSSTDNGVTWTEGTKITDGGSVTYRFPSILSPIGDTVMVTYLIDQIAGFFLYAEGAATNNPVVVQKWPNPYAPGVEGPKSVPPGRMDIAVSPNPFGRNARLSYAVPQRGNVSLAIFDAAGRTVRTLASGRSEPGRFSAVWDGRSQSGAMVPNGVYLYRYAFDGKRMTGKLTLIR